jgi:hypothetical protein
MGRDRPLLQEVGPDGQGKGNGRGEGSYWGGGVLLPPRFIPPSRFLVRPFVPLLRAGRGGPLARDFNPGEVG